MSETSETECSIRLGVLVWCHKSRTTFYFTSEVFFVVILCQKSFKVFTFPHKKVSMGSQKCFSDYILVSKGSNTFQGTSMLMVHRM